MNPQPQRSQVIRFYTHVAAAYSSGGGSLTVTAGDGPRFDVPGKYPLTVTISPQTPGAGPPIIYQVTSRSGDVLAIAPATGNADANLAVGDLVEMEFSNSIYDNASNPSAQAPVTVSSGGRAYSNSAVSTTVTATATETLFDKNYSIPANSLKAGTVIDIEYKARIIAQNSTDTFAFKLYIGGLAGTALISHAATSAAATTVVNGRIRLQIRTIGASGTFVATGSYKSVPAAPGTATYKDADVESTAIDTTVAQVIGVGVTHSSTNAGNQSALDVLNVLIF